MGRVTSCQSSWQCPVEFGDVGGEHQPLVGCLGPPPDGDVLEQVPQTQDSGLSHRDRDRLGSRLSPAPVAGPVPDQELLDVTAFQTAQCGDFWVVGREELRERQEVVDQGLDRARAQHTRTGLHVTQQDDADGLGHRHLREALLQRPRPRTTPRWLVMDSEFEQELTQARQPGPVGPQRGPGQVHGLCQLLIELIDHALVQVADRAAVPGQHDRETFVENGVDPVAGPPQLQPRGSGSVKVLIVVVLDDVAEPGQVLRAGQFQVKAQLTRADQEGHQRPGAGALELQDSVDGRLHHPRERVRMGSKEEPGRT